MVMETIDKGGPDDEKNREKAFNFMMDALNESKENIESSILMLVFDGDSETFRMLAMNVNEYDVPDLLANSAQAIGSIILDELKARTLN